ncbi:ABC transporter substrate-binding protein [Ileibacterium valens]|uniref:Fe/B12 periplasmic-binding domain-containing protein n=2 Tax=Ileibacterium valens TaxID=1862668 RepID=A0A1U7NFG5_9FIRM|nr:ABC transporter substrate-binding protein [Ileibacterium valens]OLU39069.1 hypothetical protein BO222_07255 [Ileibacterium valens]OLU41718.1 hypothetical protein BM735_03670 [Erysipelotrichaceae bacterium NYU-BL-F16]OLU41806.1 hypothetical protein BO224_02855 [Erysipelotrichaceae bacterium NYU-BL-E8]
MKKLLNIHYFKNKLNHSRKKMAFLLFAAVGICGCQSTPASSAENSARTDMSSNEKSTQLKPEKELAQDSGVIRFRDDLGQEFEIRRPERTAALIGSFADEWIDAGGKDSLVAAAHDYFTNFSSDAQMNVEDLGEVKQINAEKLIASKPDLVIASAKNESQKNLKDVLEQANIPVAYFDVSNFDDYLRTLKIFSELTGDVEAYEQAGLALQDEIDQTIERRKKADPIRVLYIRATGSSVSSKNSKGSVLGEMLSDLNTENIADSDQMMLENLSPEAILEANPDAIFVVYQGSDDTKARKNMDQALMASEAWNSLKAVKEGRVFEMDNKLYNLKPNDQWAKAYQKLADLLDSIEVNHSDLNQDKALDNGK